MGRKSLRIQQLNAKMQEYVRLKEVAVPPLGWIKAIRTSLGMSMEQLGNRLSLSKQGVRYLEMREREGAISIKTLREVGRALDMQLVYGFVPDAGSLEALIEKRAKALATQIIMRTAQSMALEDQGNSPQRIEAAIRERTKKIIDEMPKILWD